MKKDYYGVLGVDFEATEELIRTAYLKQALKWHPDKHPANEEDAKRKFQEIGEAYHVLSNPSRREDYNTMAEYDVSEFDIEEYLRRFFRFIFSTSGLGLNTSQNVYRWVGHCAHGITMWTNIYDVDIIP
eukprot:jgi/Mesvir1/915/Mv17475-RA.1